MGGVPDGGNEEKLKAETEIQVSKAKKLLFDCFLNLTRFPQMFPEFPWISPESFQNFPRDFCDFQESPRILKNSLEFPGNSEVPWPAVPSAILGETSEKARKVNKLIKDK